MESNACASGLMNAAGRSCGPAAAALLRRHATAFARRYAFLPTAVWSPKQGSTSGAQTAPDNRRLWAASSAGKNIHKGVWLSCLHRPWRVDAFVCNSTALWSKCTKGAPLQKSPQILGGRE